MQNTRVRELTKNEKTTFSDLNYFKNLLKIYPTGILSVVSDTFDLWSVLTKVIPTLKEEILSRDGKLVIRPDSGDPDDILCGISDTKIFSKENGKIFKNGKYKSYLDDRGFEIYGKYEKGNEVSETEYKGVIELLWDIFGGTTNEQGYKVLNPHIGAIYGDSITLERADNICRRLEAKGFASTNVVFGIGSFTYQFNTRDSFGLVFSH